MQIRRQLKANALSRAKNPEEYQHVCYFGCYRDMPVRDGYHGKHPRMRHKSRARSHGTSTGQSKKASK